MIFADIHVGGWFLLDGHLCQRVAPLNTANTYNFSRATWAWTNLAEKVTPTIAPVHLLPRVATDVEAGKSQVSYVLPPLSVLSRDSGSAFQTPGCLEWWSGKLPRMRAVAALGTPIL
jgi:hypothetical protein